jgi:hypothetical protein
MAEWDSVQARCAATLQLPRRGCRKAPLAVRGHGGPEGRVARFLYPSPGAW